MGKSAPLCFKFCGGRSVDHENIQATERNCSGDRRGWSFRKRSARHRVLTDGLDPEAPPSVIKENSESKAVNFHVETALDAFEKTPVVHLTEEKNVPISQQEAKLSDITVPSEVNFGTDGTFNEASVIIIQASARRFLAQKLLMKEKNVRNLQAAVRGHLVRRRALHTLRCIQAIIRIQALVRSHRASLLQQDSGDSAKQIGAEKKDKFKKEAQPKDRYAYVSIEKLLSNSFSKQLMVSMPRTKSVSIKCESFESESWTWLKRWTSVSAVDKRQPLECGSPTIEPSYAENSSVIEDSLTASLTHPGGIGSEETSEDEGSPIPYYANDSSGHPLKHEASSSCDSVPGITESAADVIKETVLIEHESANPLSKEKSGNEDLEAEKKVVSSEPPESEVKRFSRKASNPAFIAAQSKFEDLASAAAPAKSTASSSYDTGVKFSSEQHLPTAPGPRIGGSECGTELSISSTLDSDGSEAGIIEIHLETGASYGSSGVKSGWSLDEALEKMPDPSYAETQKSEDSPAIMGSHQLEKTPETNRNDPLLELISETSPRTQITAPESQETPSSQVSSKPLKIIKGEKSESRRMSRQPMITDKRSPSNLNQDSAPRTSAEHSQERKSGNSRSAKPDHQGQEPRDGSSSSSNYLPSYMRPTESARAKAIANGSPRSSPDLHDKDIYLKKRNSLPGSSEKQGSGTRV